jgi:23S rRNA pseudouridine1911/1915/1917 synthase
VPGHTNPKSEIGIPQSATLLVDSENEGLRLDAFLASQISSWSRARLQHLIADEEVLVNGKPSKSSYRLRAGDEIEVELVASPATNFTPEDLPLDIIYEDESLIVVNKPAGLVVHPAAGIQTGTLANALAFHFDRLSTKAGATRPGIVHRIDKDTSGLLVVAKTEAAHENLADQFRDRTVFKSYLALVHGVVEQDGGRIEQPLARDPRNRTRIAIVRGGRRALTLYRVQKRYDRFTLLSVEIKTGRTHQIRVHLASLKHPVVGDEVYGGGRDNTVRDPKLKVEIRKLGRHFLHAAELGFRDPVSGAELRFTAPLPTKLQLFLDLLENEDLR